ncbi:receptor-like kinase [Gossypium australe]|uniref:Receptor-like kinase n=1 Tax=Gossypium australe TaxID=47621 RepID=A0A5B6UWQ9_9ROSI|nr:receptor-like kinase [Gossypium australe]
MIKINLILNLIYGNEILKSHFSTPLEIELLNVKLALMAVYMDLFHLLTIRLFTIILSNQVLVCLSNHSNNDPECNKPSQCGNIINLNYPFSLLGETKDPLRSYRTSVIVPAFASILQRITNSFKVKLDQGGFDTIYKIKLLDGQLVAIKFLSESKGGVEEFVNEIANISRTLLVNYSGIPRFLI